MYIKQIYTDCLAEASYYIESEGEAVVIDPIREPEPYIDLAAKSGAVIKYVFETHFHADFVSGHIDLAKKTGAKIVYGPKAQTNFESHIAQDGEEFKVGKVTIKVLHTPGHTLESSSYLLLDEEGKEHAVFTGDTLFIGDVGRPDLAIKSDLTKEDLAGMLFDSLRNKIMPLPDSTTLYPGHGAGSSCGKSMSNETVSTIGEQKATNYALRDISKEQFIKEVTDGLLTPPPYFAANASLNKLGYEAYDEVMLKNMNPLSLEQFEAEVTNGAWVLDVRNVDEFEKGFIPNAINIGIDDRFALWVGGVLPIEQKLVLVVPEGREEEAIKRMARVGFENVKGYLKGGFDTWVNAGKEIDVLSSVDPNEAAKLIRMGDLKVLDVRKPTEVEAGHIEGAINIRLQEIPERFSELSKDENYLIHCAGGYRSVIASSILKKNGYHNITNIRKGYNALSKEDVPIVTGSIPVV